MKCRHQINSYGQKLENLLIFFIGIPGIVEVGLYQEAVRRLKRQDEIIKLNRGLFETEKKQV